MSTIVIQPDGTIQFVWDDALAALAEQGQCRIERASNVESTTAGWVADLSPIAGPGAPQLGPYRLRQTALAAEVEFIEDLLVKGK
jgi:hypothetical protein